MLKNTLLLISVVLPLVYADLLANNKPLLINLHGVTKEIKNIGTCGLNQWRNKPTYACECCLLEKQAELGPEASADEVIQACKDAGLCTDESLAEVRKRAGVIKGASEELLMALYDDAMVIRNMTVDSALLDANNKFTEDSLPQFLAQAFHENKLTNPDFKRAECLKAKDIASQGGGNTAQLFLVTSTCNMTDQASIYILKGATEGLGEATKLKEIEHVPGMKEIIAPHVVSGLPTVSLPIAYFSYPDKSGIGYISAMPAAKGKDITNIIAEFGDDQSPQNKARLERAFRIAGKELGNFHKRFMTPTPGKIIGRTIVHGDLQPRNIFYDEIGGHCTLIDNETMAKTIKNKVIPYYDFIKLLFMDLRTSKSFKYLLKNIDLNVWYSTVFKQFIMGYSEAYEPRDRKRVLEELKTMLNSSHGLLTATYDKKTLEERRKNYINPIMNNLIAAVERHLTK